MPNKPYLTVSISTNPQQVAKSSALLDRIFFMIELTNQINKNIDIVPLERIADSLTDKDIELVVMDDESIRELNREHRGKDRATDVLSFPLEEMDGFPLGSIVISYDKVKEVANELGHSEEDELKLLFIHGLLHLLGYDHEIDSGEMREKERELMEKFGLPMSLIERGE